MGELNNLVTQSQMNDPHVRIEQAFHLAVLAANNAKIGNLLELQYFREEVCLPLDIHDREADHFHPLYVAGQTVPRMAGMARRCH